MSHALPVALLAVDPNAVGPGLGAFLVVAGIGFATYLLIRSMNKQLKKIDFDEKATERPRRSARKASGTDDTDRWEPPSGGSGV